MDGPTVVLVHGFGSSERAWAPQVAALRDRYRVITPNLPGHGGEPGPFTLSRAVETVAAATGEKPVCLVGISGGATVSLLTCLDHPALVSGMVLSAGVARPPRKLAINRLMTRLASPQTLVRSLGNLYAGGNPEYVETVSEDLLKCGKPTLLATLREVSRLDVRSRLAEVNVPTLVVCGSEDSPNLDTSRELADGITGAELRIIPDANHCWNLQQPELFTETVSTFVDGVQVA